MVGTTEWGPWTEFGELSRAKIRGKVKLMGPGSLPSDGDCSVAIAAPATMAD